MPSYVVDTSSLVNLEQYYPNAAFSALRDAVGSLAEAGRMIAPTQVCAELSSKNDDISGWAKLHKAMFKKNTSAVIKFAIKLADKYRTMRGTSAVVEKADPYVIALAYYRARETLTGGWVVVTEEGSGPGQIPEILRLQIEPLQAGGCNTGGRVVVWLARKKRAAVRRSRTVCRS